MTFTRHDIESLIVGIRNEIESQPERIRDDGLVVELCHSQHCRLVAEYVDVQKVVFHESYVHFEVVPETGWVEIKQMELMIPYSSIDAIDRRTWSDDDGNVSYTYRLITAPGLGQFYEADEGYCLARDESDPTYVESPAATLSRIYGILRAQMKNPSTPSAAQQAVQPDTGN